MRAPILFSYSKTRNQIKRGKIRSRYILIPDNLKNEKNAGKKIRFWAYRIAKCLESCFLLAPNYIVRGLLKK